MRERLLDDPPPPPPNVPGAGTDSKIALLPFANSSSITADPACADCHHGIDGWGHKRGEYDAVGLWRDNITRRCPTETISAEAGRTGADARWREVEGMAALGAYLLEARDVNLRGAGGGNFSPTVWVVRLNFPTNRTSIDGQFKKITSEYVRW